MLQIYEPHEATVKLLGEQKVCYDKQYRRLNYLLDYEVSEGLLIYNVLTRHLILLSNDERSFVENPTDVNNSISAELIKNWFLVPEETDEFTLSNQVYNLISSFYYSNTNPMHIFTIFPTTDCDARCFYCFERGRTRTNMTPQTALDVADFIIKKSKGADEIKIRWFGGEPLFNSQVIDIICNKLRSAGIKFKSHITTNAYLFDKQTAERAVKDWNVFGTQITLDGTEDIYNRSKNFIYKDGSAFKVVINNISHILESGIFVSVRMNMDAHNSNDLYELTDFLYEKFGEYRNFFAYAHLLFEDSGKLQMERNDIERHMMIHQFFELSKYISSKFPQKNNKTVHHLMQYHQCMADDPSTTTILPGGELGKCEHYSDNYFWGSIYSDKINYDSLNAFREYQNLGEQCVGCQLRPMCRNLVLCAQTVPRCDSVDKELRLNHIRKCVMTTYNNYKNNLSNEDGSKSDESFLVSDC